jgi:hypothetical protein
VCRFPLRREDGSIAQNPCGLPTGTHLQLVFENLYLRSVDNELHTDDGNSVYSRFGDDVLFVSRDKARADAARDCFANFAKQATLTFHPEKSVDLLLAPSHTLPRLKGDRDWRAVAQFEYLGLDIDVHGNITLPTRKTRVMMNFLKERFTNTLAAEGALADVDERVRLLSRVVVQALERGQPLPESPF